VREALVEGLDAHPPHALGDELPDRIVDHRRGDSRTQAEAVGEVGGGVELAAAHVDDAGMRLAKRDDAGVETVNEGAEREKIERAIGSNLQRLGHESSLVSGVQSV
jgi:hypothetical protein